MTVRIIGHGKGGAAGGPGVALLPLLPGGRAPPAAADELGLAIAKGFLALMGGQIWIEDTPGGGATFAPSVPASVPAAR